jgi:hypothetical protein
LSLRPNFRRGLALLNLSQDRLELARAILNRGHRHRDEMRCDLGRYLQRRKDAWWVRIGVSDGDGWK